MIYAAVSIILYTILYIYLKGFGMKNILTLFLVLIVFSLDATAQVPSYVSKIGLQGWWGFNENPNDESGNGNHDFFLYLPNSNSEPES
jgi:hypothetical protein